MVVDISLRFTVLLESFRSVLPLPSFAIYVSGKIFFRSQMKENISGRKRERMMMMNRKARLCGVWKKPCHVLNLLWIRNSHVRPFWQTRFLNFHRRANSFRFWYFFLRGRDPNRGPKILRKFPKILTEVLKSWENSPKSSQRPKQWREEKLVP